MNVIKAKKPSQIRKRRNNSASSKGVKHRKFTYTVQQLTDIVASPIRVTLHGHGVNNIYYVKGQKFNDFTEGTSVGSILETTGGNLRSLGCHPGRQVYFEDIALKYGEPDSNNTAPWTLSIKEMMIKAYNDGHMFSATSSQPTLGMTTDNNKINNNLIYHGGSVVHKFTNTLKTCCYLEFREFSPRQVMPGLIFWTGGAVGSGTSHFKNDGIYRTLVRDLQLQAGGSSYPVEDATNAFNEFDDKGFKYNSKCLITNSKWVVGPAVKVKLMPGETYTYKMVLHPFKMNDTQFGIIIGTGFNTLLNGPEVNPVELPGFTKHLSMRAWGESNVFSVENMWSDANATTNTTLDPMPGVTPNITEAQVTQLDRVASSSVRLAHTRSEYHTFRAVPQFANKVTDIVKDFRDWGTTKYVAGTDQTMMDIDGEGLVQSDLAQLSALDQNANLISQNS